MGGVCLGERWILRIVDSGERPWALALSSPGDKTEKCLEELPSDGAVIDARLEVEEEEDGTGNVGVLCGIGSAGNRAGVR